MQPDPRRVYDARAAYFAANGFSDAAYSDAWVKVKLGPLPITFPNVQSRKSAIPIHDLHHIATGYATTIHGEIEIGAWEIAASPRDRSAITYWAAWVLNFASFGVGLVVAPRRLWRAFVRGRHSTTIYATGWKPELLEITVDELRARLRLDRPARPATWSDRAVFAACIAIVAAPGLAVLGAGALIIRSLR